MDDKIILQDGDCTFSKSFNKICIGENGQQYTFGFKANKGRKFVTLLLGDVPADAVDCDAEAMLNALGFYRKEQPQ